MSKLYIKIFLILAFLALFVYGFFHFYTGFYEKTDRKDSLKKQEEKIKLKDSKERPALYV